MRNSKSIDILNRLKRITETDTDASLCDALGTSPQTLSSWKGRNSIPYAMCVTLAQARGISLDWLLAGHGPMLRRARVPASTYGCADTDDILMLIHSLDEDDQRFVRQLVGERKRLRDLERRLETLTSSLAALTRHG